MSVTRRNTRSASRAGSDDSAPSVGNQSRSTRSATRIAQENPSLRSKSTRLYGTTGEIDAAAQLQRRENMEKAVNTIQGGLRRSAQDGGAGGPLSTVEEEGQGGDLVSVDGGDFSWSAQSRKVSQLTAIKTFEKEGSVSKAVQAKATQDSNKLVANWLYTQDSSRVTVWDGFLTLSTVLTWLIFSLSLVTTIWMWWQWNPAINALIRTDLITSLPTKLSTIFHQLDTTSNRLNTLSDRFDKLSDEVARNDNLLRVNDRELRVFKSDIKSDITSIEQRVDIYDRRVLRVNYFSFDLGARVNPYLTSPRMMRPVSVPQEYSWDIWSFWFRGSSKKQTMQYTSQNSDQALKSWAEPLDRWCAPSTRGKLQLAVMMPRTIAPEYLVIEHFPRGGLIQIGTAPKEVELWVRILDDNVRGKLLDVVKNDYPDIMTSRVSQEGKILDKKQALDRTWIPVGAWTYSIYHTHHVQRFEIRYNLNLHKVAVKEAVVRVNSNWGSLDSTCLYRVVLHGMDKSGLREYLEGSPGR